MGGTNNGDANARMTRIRKGDVLLLLEDGHVWLSRSGDSLPSAGDVDAALEEGGVSAYDEHAVRQFVEGQEARVRIAPAPAPVDSKVSVTIAKDSMSVSIVVSPPSLGGTIPSPESIRELLGRHGVVHGVDREILERISAGECFDERFEAARATPPVHGTDAVIERTVAATGRRGPVEDEDGNVDLRNLGIVNLVRAGDVLAVKIPATAGIEGKNVRGAVLGAKSGKDKSFPGGPGTAVSEDGLSLLAAIEGHMTEVNGRFHVLPVFQVEGDVDYGTGNIDFPGSVVVKGVVRDGFEIRASENITVNGMVEGALLSAGGSIVVTGGIRGVGKGKVEAQGNISADFVDQASLSSGGDILIKNALLHTDCRCSGKLVVSGGSKAQIAGGKIQAGREVVCQTLGSEMGTKTEISVGALPEQVERRDSLRTELADAENNLGKVEKNIEFLKKAEVESGLDEEKRAMLGKLTRTAFSLRASMKENSSELAVLEAEMEKNREKGAVRARGTCYPGVSVSMRGVTHRVREEERFCAFLYEEGEIRAKPFDF